MSLMERLLLSLLLTLLIEGAFAFFTGKRKKALVLCLLVNLLTNPLVVLTSYLVGGFTSFPLWLAKALLEGAAVTAEALFYRQCEAYKRPWLFSLGANGLSFSCGLLVSILL